MLAECVELYQRLPTDVKISRASGSHVTKGTRERIITTFRARFDERVRWRIPFFTRELEIVSSALFGSYTNGRQPSAYRFL